MEIKANLSLSSVEVEAELGNIAVVLLLLIQKPTFKVWTFKSVSAEILLTLTLSLWWWCADSCNKAQTQGAKASGPDVFGPEGPNPQTQ